MIGDLKSILRNRLKPCKSIKILKWFGLNKIKRGHIHHILESVHGLKLNDYFLVDKDAEKHAKIHYEGQSEEEFLNDFIESLENLLDYVEYNERKRAD